MAVEDDVAALKRQVRILERKLERSDANRRKLELAKDRSDLLHRNIIEQMQQNEAALRESEAAALQASRAKSEFLANVSHEIRTPMNGVLGMTDLLLRGGLQPRQRDTANKVFHSATALMQLIDDLLDFSKIEAGRLALESVEFDLVEVIEEATMLFANASAEAGVDLTCDVTSIGPVMGDPLRLRQIVTNLVSNAVKFTARGRIAVRATELASEPDSVRIRVEVADTGIGFAPGTEEALFQPFSQADGSTTRRFGGTGLGLAIVRELVELMDGVLNAEGQEGEGARFWFDIDLARDPLVAAAPAPALTGRSVAVVSPARGQRDAVVGTLRRLGATVTASESIDLEQKPLPAAIVLDSTHADHIATASAEFRIVVVMAPHTIPTAPLEAAGVHVVVARPPRQRELVDALTRAHGRRHDGRTRRRTDAVFPGMRVLVAEDNEINREVAVAALAALCCTVTAVADGREAVEAAGRDTFDLVLLDCQMPVMDGLEAAALIRAHPRTASTPIVALTANALRRDRERCAEAGMNDMLSKPFTVQQLGAMLRRWSGG